MRVAWASPLARASSSRWRRLSSSRLRRSDSSRSALVRCSSSARRTASASACLRASSSAFLASSSARRRPSRSSLVRLRSTIGARSHGACRHRRPRVPGADARRAFGLGRLFLGRRGRRLLGLGLLGFALGRPGLMTRRFLTSTATCLPRPWGKLWRTCPPSTVVFSSSRPGRFRLSVFVFDELSLASAMIYRPSIRHNLRAQPIRSRNPASRAHSRSTEPASLPGLDARHAPPGRGRTAAPSSAASRQLARRQCRRQATELGAAVHGAVEGVQQAAPAPPDAIIARTFSKPARPGRRGAPARAAPTMRAHSGSSTASARPIGRPPPPSSRARTGPLSTAVATTSRRAQRSRRRGPAGVRRCRARPCRPAPATKRTRLGATARSRRSRCSARVPASFPSLDRLPSLPSGCRLPAVRRPRPPRASSASASVLLVGEPVGAGGHDDGVGLVQRQVACPAGSPRSARRRPGRPGRRAS